MECGVSEDSVGALVAKAQECRVVQELSLAPASSVRCHHRACLSLTGCARQKGLWLPQNPRWQYGDQVTIAHQAGSLKCIGR